ncbi:MAG: arsenite methyltransferase [Myxococcales bacterium]|nr:arsenite methyltransferase [Myxococcales bacterium]MCB9641521.1 arsenite methyltransferase [Myxococcales bacterium]
MATQEQIRKEVQTHYGAIAKGDASALTAPKKQQSSSCCAPTCCSGEEVVGPEAISTALGYRSEEIAQVPQGANMGLGCGNPQAIAALKEGETVLDLGSGAGFDSFLAAKQVGQKGRVIGVDMTPEMVKRARANAEAGDFPQVEFREGLIEALPVEDDTVDVVISNCVINLSPEKPQVFREAYRVLRAGGRLAISDVVALQPLPTEMREAIGLIAGCVGQSAEVQEIEGWLREAGFVDIQVKTKPESRAFIQHWFPESGAEEYVSSAVIEARKALV